MSKIKFLENVKKIFKNEVAVKEDNSIPYNEVNNLINAIRSGTNTVSVTKDNAMKNSDIVYSCINLIASTISRMSINLYKETLNGKEKVLDKDILYVLKKRPNLYQTPSDFLYSMISTMLLYGNSYAYIKVYSGKIEELIVLDGSSTQLVKDHMTGKYTIRTMLDNKQLILQYEEVIHLRDACFGNSIEGVSRLDSIITKIESKLKSQQVVDRLYDNDGVKIQGLLNIDGEISDEAKLKIKKAFIEAVQGGVGILSGSSSYQSVSQPSSLVDQQFVDVCGLTEQDISMIFQLNPALLGNTDSTNYSNMIEIYNQFIQNLIPIITRLEEEMSYKLLNSNDRKLQYFKFNVNGMLRASALDRAEYLGKLLEKGSISINESRAELDYNPVDGGDVIRVDLNHVALDKVDEYQENKSKQGLKQEVEKIDDK